MRREELADDQRVVELAPAHAAAADGRDDDVPPPAEEALHAEREEDDVQRRDERQPARDVQRDRDEIDHDPPTPVLEHAAVEEPLRDDAERRDRGVDRWRASLEQAEHPPEREEERGGDEDEHRVLAVRQSEHRVRLAHGVTGAPLQQAAHVEHDEHHLERRVGEQPLLQEDEAEDRRVEDAEVEVPDVGARGEPDVDDSRHEAGDVAPRHRHPGDDVARDA